MHRIGKLLLTFAVAALLCCAAAVVTLVGCAKDAVAQAPAQVQPVPDPNPDLLPIPRPELPQPNWPGLDPIEQARHRDRMRITELEDRLDRAIWAINIQARQISQLQGLLWRMGRIGDQQPIGAPSVPSPIGQPPATGSQSE